MAGYVLLGALAAFGALSALWCLFGGLLPQAAGCAVVFYGQTGEEALWRLRWLRSLGLLRCPVIAVAEAQAQKDVEICSPEALLSRLIEERNRGNGTGNGDPPGRHQRRGLSEL